MTGLGDVAWPPVPLTTERLVLRASEARDRAAFIELFASPEVGAHIGGPRPREELERVVPEVPGQRSGQFVVERDGAMIGTVTLGRRDAERPGHVRPDGGEAELGYLFLPHAWGHGYAAEACAAILDWFAGVRPGEPVVLCTRTASDRALRLAGKLGFTEVERFEEYGAEQWFGVWSPDPARPAERARVNDYDSFAEAYAAETENGPVNAFYERPAMLALAGDVTGRRILDAGCGSGPLSAALRERGADVTGVDASAAMLALARRRLGDDADLYLADLREQLPFDDGTFDDVVASLVLHYLQDWGPTLSEIRRVLRPGGRLIASVDHPFVAYTFSDPRPDYFATTSYSFEWTVDGQTAPMRFWRKPLHAMFDAFSTAGFRISTVSEPQPDPAARDRFPDAFHALSTRPTFLFFVAEVPRPVSQDQGVYRSGPSA